MNTLRMVLLSLLLSVALSQPAWTQTSGSDGQSDGYSSGDGGHDGPDNDNLSGLRDPNQIVARLTEISNLCQGADIYVVDCLAERLETLENDMSGLVGFGDARRIFRDTSAQLRAITQNNLAPDRPKARMVSHDGNLRSARPLSAVAPARKRQAISQAVAVLAEAETRLLRSAEASAGRALNYQQIAAALGSNKVLLRSG